MHVVSQCKETTIFGQLIKKKGETELELERELVLSDKMFIPKPPIIVDAHFTKHHCHVNHIPSLSCGIPMKHQFLLEYRESDFSEKSGLRHAERH